MTNPELNSTKPPVLDLDKPIQTQDGRKVRILCKNLEEITGILTPWPIVGVILDSRFVHVWSRTGEYYMEGTVPNDHWSDLVNVPETRIGYINVVCRPSGLLPDYVSSYIIFGDKEAALKDSSAGGNSICVRIEYEV